MFTVLEAIEKGGFVMILLAALSVFSLGIILFKLIQFFRAGMLTSGSLDSAAAFVTAGHPQKTLTPLSRSHPGFTAIDALLSGAPAEYVALCGNRGFRRAESYTRTLEVIAAISPLMGLLGTVIGMVKAFSGISASGANVDPGMLAGGIWEALLTTIAGLAVAIPALAAAHFFSARTERAREQTEEIGALLLSERRHEQHAVPHYGDGEHSGEAA